MAIYGEDLANIHHQGFTQSLRNAVPSLLEILRSSGIVSGTIVDLGCGSGVWARALTDAGYDVTGIDASLPMLRLARRIAPRATFQRASLFHTSIPPCSAVTALGECLNYDASKEGASTRWQSLHGLFRKVLRQLRAGGLFLFDIHAQTNGAVLRRRKVVRSVRDWRICYEAKINGSGTRLVRRIEISRTIGRMARSGTEFHVLQLYNPARIAGMLEGAGFCIRMVDRYGDVPLLPGRVGFIAQKPCKADRWRGQQRRRSALTDALQEMADTCRGRHRCTARSIRRVER